MKWKNKGHEFDKIGYLLKGKKHIYLYGAGDYASEIITIIHGLKKWIDWEIHLIDRDMEKQKTGWLGYNVIAPEEFFIMEKEDYFVVASADGESGEEIYAILEENLEANSVFFKGFYFLYTYLSIYFLYIHDMVFFLSENMLPSTICNLNCRDCLNFMPYIKKHYIEDLEDLKRNVDLFFHAVDMVYRFQITGGEPLLYKDLQKLLEYIDRNYRSRILRLEMVTNGTIIPDDELCQFLHEKEIYVFLDDYRLSLPDGKERYDKVQKQLVKYNINYADNHVEQWIRAYIPDEDDGKILPEEVLYQKYAACNNPWSSLYQGKITACNYAMYADRAGICKAFEDESFELYDFTSDKKKELVEFRLRMNKKGYMNFCNICGGWTSISNRWCKPAIQSKRGENYEME